MRVPGSRVAACLLFAALVWSPLADADPAPHLRALLAQDDAGRSLRAELFSRLGGALGGAAALEPQDRATAMALALQTTLCPAGVDLAGARPDLRTRLLVDRCGPWLPDGTNPDRLIADAGCGDLLISLTAAQKELARGPGAMLGLALRAASADGAAAPMREGICRMVMLPTLIGALTAQSGSLRDERLAVRLDVRLNKGRVSVGLVGEDGLRLQKHEGVRRAALAPAGRRIDIPATRDGSVDAAALRDVARSVRALLADAPGAVQVAASAETPYSAVVAVIDALREAPGPDGKPMPLFPDVIFSAPPGKPGKEPRP